MGSGYAKMKKQSRLLEQQMEMMKLSLKEKRFTGTSGGGLVTITLDGEKTLKGIKIQPECVNKEEVEALEDLIQVAFEEALAKVEEALSSQGGGYLL